MHTYIYIYIYIYKYICSYNYTPSTHIVTQTESTSTSTLTDHVLIGSNWTEGPHGPLRALQGLRPERAQNDQGLKLSRSSWAQAEDSHWPWAYRARTEVPHGLLRACRACKRNIYISTQRTQLQNLLPHTRLQCTITSTCPTTSTSTCIFTSTHTTTSLSI